MLTKLCFSSPSKLLQPFSTLVAPEESDQFLGAIFKGRPLFSYGANPPDPSPPPPPGSCNVLSGAASGGHGGTGKNDTQKVVSIPSLSLYLPSVSLPLPMSPLGLVKDYQKGGSGLLPDRAQWRLFPGHQGPVHIGLADILHEIIEAFWGFSNVPWRRRAFGPGTKDVF